MRHALERFRLGSTERRQRRASLAVEVLDLELVEVRDVEALHAEPGERQQVGAPHPSQPCDGDTGTPDDGLFVGCDPANVARERNVIVEGGGRHSQVLVRRLFSCFSTMYGLQVNNLGIVIRTCQSLE